LLIPPPDHYRIEYLTPVGRELEKLLKIPINNFNDILTVLNLVTNSKILFPYVNLPMGQIRPWQAFPAQ
jgi:hypothetical protein